MVGVLDTYGKHFMAHVPGKIPSAEDATELEGYMHVFSLER